VLADVWYSQNRLDLALVADPLQGRYHWAFGQGLIAIGSPSRGLNEMQLAARLGESDPQLYVDIGDTEQGLGRSAEARAAYQMALEIDPFNVAARRRLAGIGVPPSG
jgi:Flp pilus assembly protein TadD